MKLTEDFVRTVIDSARTAGDWPGSAAHKDFASTVAKHRARSGSYLDFAADLTDGLMEVCERAGLDEALIVSALRTTVPYVVGSAWWADLGFPTITLTPDFQRAAAVTDFGDGGAEPVHLPFPAFLLRLPESLRGAPEAAPCFVYPVPQVVDGAADFHTSRMTLSPDGDLRQGYTQWLRGTPFSEFLHGKARPIEGLDPVEKQATDLLNQNEPGAGTIDHRLTARARLILGNTLLYINGNGGLPATKRTGPDLPVEREHATLPRFRVGRPVKLGGALREAIGRGLESPSAWKLVSRFIVRGHFRNQAYGPNLSLRRRQWIEPFWKGPSTLEALSREYEVT